MQTSNNCLVLLTGHGGEYDHQKVIDMNSYDYKVVFPIPLKGPLTDGHHNHLLKLFSLNAPEAYAMLSDLPTTTTAHKNNIPAQKNDLPNQISSINLADQHCQYVNEHYLTSGNKPNNAFSLDQFAPERYKAYPLNSAETWSGHLEVILDQGQILQELNKIIKTQDYQYDNKNFQIKLSSETCLQIRVLEKSFDKVATSLFANPFGQSRTLEKSFDKISNSLFANPFDQSRTLEKSFDKISTSLFANPLSQVVISLSKFLDSIIPNIRIPFLYHADSNMIDIIPNLYLNDGGVKFKSERICQDFVGMVKKPTDFYFEAVIPSDAYLIWDASRNEMQFKLLGSQYH